MRVVAVANLAASPVRFEADPAGLVVALRAGRRDGLEPLALWHSHPGRPARPSAADRRGGWAGLPQVLVGLRGRRVVELRCWRALGAGEATAAGDGEGWREEPLAGAGGGVAPPAREGPAGSGKPSS